MPFETEFRDRLSATVGDITIDTDTLSASGITAGTRRLRRRRLTAALATAVVLASAGGAYAFWPSAEPSPPVAGPSSAPPITPMIPEDILQLLRKLLPANVPTTALAGGWNTGESGDSPYGSLDYGTNTKLVLSLSRTPSALTSCRAPLTVLRCDRTKLTDGSTQTLFEGYDPARNNRLWEIRLDRRDGLTITLDQFTTTPTPTKPPHLPLTTMRTITQNPAWHL